MAEIIESTQNHVPSNGKVNAALTLGIIGTALSALNTGGGIFGMVHSNCNTKANTPCGGDAGITNEELYLERSQCQNYLNLT